MVSSTNALAVNIPTG